MTRHEIEGRGGHVVSSRDNSDVLSLRNISALSHTVYGAFTD